MNLIVDEQKYLSGKLDSSSGVKLASDSGVSLLAEELEDYESHVTSSKSKLWHSGKGWGHDHSRVAPTEITGGVDIIAKDITVEGRSEKAPWVKELEAKIASRSVESDTIAGSIMYRGIADRSDSWSYKYSHLSPEASAVVSVAAAAGAMWTGGFGTGIAEGIGLSGSAATVASAAIDAGIASMASKAAVSGVNHGFDLGKVLGDITTPESLRSTGKSMLVAGATAGITEKLGMSKAASTGDFASRSYGMIGRSLVGAGVSSAITGQKFSDGLARQAGSEMLALGQEVVGDIGAKYKLSEGGVAKTA